MRRLLVMCVALAACGTSKPEAASLVASVERFHRASNDERPARADDVAKVVCEAPDVCEAKTLCTAATTPTGKALRLKHEAEAILGDLEAGRRQKDDPDVQALARKLDDATTLLTEGHEKMPACDMKILILRERYGL
jgi:hypothetical protein